MNRISSIVATLVIFLILSTVVSAWPWSKPAPPPPPPVEKSAPPPVTSGNSDPVAADSPKMGLFYGVLANGAIIIGIALQIGMALWLVVAAPNPIQKIMRVTAFTTGLLIFFGARSLGLSLSSMLLLGINQYSPIKFGFFSLIVPSALGYVLAWYFIRSLKRSDEMAIKIMILVSVFLVLQFGDIYLRVASIGGLALNKALVPNLAFTIAIGLYTTLKHDFKEF